LLLDGRFKLERLLGVGGMGSTVWRAQQASMQRRVAIKLLPSLGDITAQRFGREARIAASLRHPNIVTIIDYGQTDDAKLYLVMEHLDGKTLEQVIRRESTLSVQRTCHIAWQVLRALSHAHDKRVVHRDLKPSNLFLCPTDDDSDFAKVLDFGLAKTFDDGDDAGNNSDLTAERQTVCGTPTYMSPEQWRGQTDNRTDLYALGVIMFRMLTGRAPFLGGPDYELYHRVNTEPVPPMSGIEAAANVPKELESIILRALAKKVDERYPSARVMRQDLEQFMRLFLTDDERPDKMSLENPMNSSHRHEAVPLTVATGSLASEQVPLSARTSGIVSPPRRRPFFWMGFGALAVVCCGLIVATITGRSIRTNLASDSAQYAAETSQNGESSPAKAWPGGTRAIADSRLDESTAINSAKTSKVRELFGLPALVSRAVELEVRAARRGEELEDSLPQP
jgi:serine/threonine-protein kinase